MRTSTAAAATRCGCWDVATRGDRRLASHCFASTSTGSGVAGVIATGGRALWLTYTGGNIREWSLWTKAGQGRAEADRLPRGRRRRAGAGRARTRLGGLAAVRARPHDRRARAERLAAVLADRARRVVALSAHSRGYAAVLANGSVLTISLAGQAAPRAHRSRQVRSGRGARRAGPDREDAARARDPRRRHGAEDPAAAARASWALRGDRSPTGSAASCGCARSPSGERHALPHARAALPCAARPPRARLRAPGARSGSRAWVFVSSAAARAA